MSYGYSTPQCASALHQYLRVLRRRALTLDEMLIYSYEYIRAVLRTLLTKRVLTSLVVNWCCTKYEQTIKECTRKSTVLVHDRKESSCSWAGGWIIICTSMYEVLLRVWHYHSTRTGCTRHHSRRFRAARRVEGGIHSRIESSYSSLESRL